MIINFIFLVSLFSEKTIELDSIRYFLTLISLVLVELSSFKNKNKTMGILFFISLLLLTIHFFINKEYVIGLHAQI